LDDAEYARRAAGKDARFLSESRMPTGYYGPMRFATNPSAAAFRQWAVAYHVRMIQDHPLASGFFMDNSDTVAPVRADEVVEAVATYGDDYGAMLQAITQAIAPRWILPNTTLARAEAIIRHNPAYFEEFAIRPLSAPYRAV
jgi:hypothetical protein